MGWVATASVHIVGDGGANECHDGLRRGIFQNVADLDEYDLLEVI